MRQRILIKIYGSSIVIDKNTSIPNIVRNYGFNSDYVEDIISNHLSKYCDAMINESLPNTIIFNDSSIINLVSELDSHATRLSLKLNMTKEDTLVSVVDYLKKKEIHIISSGLTGHIQTGVNFFINVGIISNVQYVIDIAQMSNLSGLKLAKNSPLIYLTLPTLFGISFRCTNAIFPNTVIGNVSLFCSDVCFMPANAVQIFWNERIASSATRIGLPYVPFNIIGNHGAGFEACRYLLQNKNFRRKL